MEEFIDYSIVDSNGDVYIQRIKKSEKHKYDLDHLLVYRTLNELKLMKQAPVCNRMDGGSGNAPAPQKSGKQINPKNGFKWTPKTVDQLLSECLNHREALRACQVPITLWKNVASVLNLQDCLANPEQCREKFRNLKATFSNVKAGVAGVKKKWPHELLMRRILDEVISDETRTESINLVDVQGTGRNINISKSKNVDSNDSSVDIRLHVSGNFTNTTDEALVSNNQDDNARTVTNLIMNEGSIPGPIITSSDLHSSHSSDNVDSTVSFALHVSGNFTNTTDEALVSNNQDDNARTVTNLIMNEGSIPGPIITSSDLHLSHSSDNADSSVSFALHASGNFANTSHEGDAWNQDLVSYNQDDNAGIDKGSSPNRVFTLSRADVNLLGVQVLPIDSEILTFSDAYVKIKTVSPERNNKTQSSIDGNNNEPEIIILDCDSDTECKEAENICNATLGQTTFDSNVRTVSTPEVGYSPPKKKSSLGFVFRSPSNKTPKRKIAATKLIWDSQTTDHFVAACLSRKDYLQKDVIPVKIWKDIKSEMNQIGHNEIWECYRAKFNQMNNYFANSLLAAGGLIHGIMWPYYYNFCSLHDIPIDFAHADGDETDERILTPSKKRRIWVEDAEKLLIQLYSDRKEKFDGTKSTIRHSTLYSEISSFMRENHVNVTAKQCKAHMNELLSEFRKAYDNSRKTGGGAIEFRHYDIMLKIFENSATLVTPYATSVGRGLKYTVNGEQKFESNTGSRSRPKSSAGDTSKKGSSGSIPKKKLYRSYKEEMLQKNIALREEQNEEFRLMRIGFEKKSEERSRMIQQLVQLACLQMQMSMGHKPTFDNINAMQKETLEQLQSKPTNDFSAIELD